MRTGVLQSALEVLYPPCCLLCGGLVSQGGSLCGPCWRDVPFLTGAGCHQCAAPLMGEVEEGDLCTDCMLVSRPWDRGVAAMAYEAKGRELVLSLKHGDRHDISRASGVWMQRAIAPLPERDWLIVPVPLYRWRRIRRRFNQSALICKALSHETGHEWEPEALSRPVPTPFLKGMSADERHRALDGAIVPGSSKGAALRGRAVLIVDDVMTSGATFAAAATAAYAAGATHVCVAALARVVKSS